MDYFDDSISVEISLDYSISEKEQSVFRKYLVTETKFPKELTEKLKFNSVIVTATFLNFQSSPKNPCSIIV